ncbi:MAG: hypothetical protein JWL79_1849 [Frankiales bacterium]|nr:hypothetical protein [Frankiales bacterium]
MTVVVELDPSGHRLKYVELLCRQGAAFWTSNEVVTSPEFRVINPVPEQLVILRDDRTPLAEALIDLATRYNRVVVPDADRYLAIFCTVALRRPWLLRRFSLLLLRDPRVGLRPRSLLKRALASLLRLLGSAIFVLDSDGISTPRRWPRLCPIADPPLIDSQVLTRAAGIRQARAADAQRSDVFRVGVFGALTDRKCIASIAEACVAVNAELHLVGGVSQSAWPDVRTASRLLNQRLLLDDRFVTDEELAMAIAGVDVCAVVHTNTGPSGIAQLSRIVGTPVLLGGRAAVLRRDGDYSCPAIDGPQLATALRVALSDDRSLRATPSNAVPVFARALLSGKCL